jgi:hypothetical protein
MYQILYGAMPDSEIMTIEESKFQQEKKKERENLAKKAKRLYEMSQKRKVHQTDYILQGSNHVK